MSARVRIGKVKMKGGAEVRVLHNDRPRRVWQSFLRDCDFIFERRGHKIAGYALVVWDIYGGSSTASIAAPTVPSFYVPELAKQALINRDIRTDCAEDILGAPKPDEPA